MAIQDTDGLPPFGATDAHPHNLPIQPTALLGRERELDDPQRILLRAGTRHVTLTGPGGTGKTRLGLQVAAELGSSFSDGVFLIELAPVTDPSLVPSTIAQVLGVRDMGNRPVLESLKEYLRRKSILLVLDNFEQILPAGSMVADLLATSPGLKVLVTSREPRYLRGERVYAVPPLPLPDGRHVSSPEDLASYAAAALFIERAVGASGGLRRHGRKRAGHRRDLRPPRWLAACHRARRRAHPAAQPPRDAGPS